MSRFLHILFVCLILLAPVTAATETFLLPAADSNIIGELRYATTRDEETLVDIAREFDLGYDQIIKANPGVNRWIPGEGTRVIIPHRYVLPDGARKGIVLNIAELRLYFFPVVRKGEEQKMYSYPISIGRMDWSTPIGTTKIVKKERDPAWYPPKSIREEHARDGEILPEVFPGGSPDNPLGRFALRLGFPGYLIHGVDERKTYGIGMRVTHGCIRMYPEDIEALFALVSTQTPVTIMNQSVKVGWIGERLYLEVHQPLNEGEDEQVPDLPRIELPEVTAAIRKVAGEGAVVNSSAVQAITERGDGIPRVIGQRDPAQIDSETGTADVEAGYRKAIERHLKPRAADMPSEDPDPIEVPRAARQESAEGHGIDVRRYIEEQY